MEGNRGLKEWIKGFRGGQMAVEETEGHREGFRGGQMDVEETEGHREDSGLLRDRGP